MIDIHVLTHSQTRKDWLAQCLKSLDGQPVIVHVVEGVDGSVGAGRAKGFSIGSCEYVGYVDSDDYVIAGHYEKCLKMLTIKRAVVGMEYVEYLDGSRHKMLKANHNGAVYRREDISKLIKCIRSAPYTADMLTRNHIKPYQMSHAGYVWRVYSGGAHRKINESVFALEKSQWLQQLS